MPVQDQTPVNSYTGNGVATTFAYTFKIFANADLKVEVDGVVKTLTADYSVTGAGASGGGNVVFVNPPASGAKVVIYRNLAYSRSTDYVDNGDLLAQTLDDDIDRIAMLIQQLRHDKNRALKLSISETADQVIAEDAAARAGKLVGFDALGALILKTAADLGAVSIGDGLQVLSNILSAKVGDGIQIVSGEIRVGSDVFRTADIFSDFVVSGLLGVDPGASLAMTIPGGTAYVMGLRVVKSGSDADMTRTYTASKDTYVDISKTGAITYSEVANGAAAPAVAANSIRLMKVVTNGTEITSVVDLRALNPAQSGSMLYAAASGTNTYTATLSPAPAALVHGMEIRIKFSNASTGTSTLNLNSLGAKKVYIEVDGVYTQVGSGDIFAGMNATLSYDSALDAAAGGWVLKNKKVSSSAGKVVQIVNSQTGAVASGSTTIPQDDTLPQNTEGDEYMTLAITPTDASNILYVDVVFQGSNANGNSWVAALFKDANADALACSSFHPSSAGNNVLVPLKIKYKMTAGTTSAMTFKVRAGANSSGTITNNGVSGGRLYGGALISSITITEVTP